MKKVIIGLMVLSLSLFAVPVMADMDIDTPIVRPSLDKFRVLDFRVVNNSAPYVSITADIGYMDGPDFVVVRNSTVRITNLQITYNGTTVSANTEDGFIPPLPAEYAVNPANVVMGHINSGTFGGQATATAYLEQLVKTLGGL